MYQEDCKPLPSPLEYLCVYRDGRVQNTRTGNFLKPEKINSGYLSVKTQIGGRTIHRLVHRLVAEAFVPNPHGLTVVNHIDGNRLNNDYRNLEWTTQKGNLLKAQQAGLSPDRSLNPFEIANRKTGEMYIFSSFKEALLYLGLNPGRYCYNEKLRKYLLHELPKGSYTPIVDTDGWFIRLAIELKVSNYSWDVM